MFEVLEGDCLKVLRTLPSNSVDLICTDPPYFKVKADWWDRQWSDPSKFLEWLDSIAAEWARVLKPNGSLYCFASPKMSARVEVMLSGRFNVLNNIRWTKDEGWHKKAAKGISRQFHSPWESVIFCEHYGADNIAKGEAGYQAKCDELRGFVFEPLRAYLDGERERARISIRGVAEAFQQKTGSRTVTGMAGHWFTSVQWTLPTEENYLWLRRLLGGDHLRREYEDLRRPFSVTDQVPYTDVWTFPTVQTYPGKHPCEKPLGLLKHIIQASSRPGAIILDCFCGSGNTAVAAKDLGRGFVVCDIDPHWVNVTRGRVGQTQRFISDAERLTWLAAQSPTRNSQAQKLSAQLSFW